MRLQVFCVGEIDKLADVISVKAALEYCHCEGMESFRSFVGEEYFEEFASALHTVLQSGIVHCVKIYRQSQFFEIVRI